MAAHGRATPARPIRWSSLTRTPAPVDSTRRGAVGAGTLLVLAPLLLMAGFALGRWSAPAGSGTPSTPADAPYRVAAPGAARAAAAATKAATTTVPIQIQRRDRGPQELIPLPGGPDQGQGPGQGQNPGQGQAPAPGQGDCMLFMFRDGRLFQFGGPGAPGAPGTQPSPFGFGGPGTGPGGGPGGPQELYPLQPAPSPGLPAPNSPPQMPSAPMPAPRMSRAPIAPPSTTPAPSSAMSSTAMSRSAMPSNAMPSSEAPAHPDEGRS